MPHTRLFTPFQVGKLKLDNRIVIAPMCQYSAVDGCMTDWHLIHLGQLALSGAGLLTIEATAVVPEGRITYGDVGLYSDPAKPPWRRFSPACGAGSSCPSPSSSPCRAQGLVRSAMEGRRANSTDLSQRLADRRAVLLAHVAGREPADGARAATDLARIREAFVAAAKRAARLGIDAVQLHGAHGYLMHQFLSPLSNLRDDDYGGSLENRMRFPLEVFDAVRAAFPADRPVTMRVSATDWIDGGWTVEETVAFAQALEKRGCSAIHVSSGGLAAANIPLGPGYQVALARDRSRTPSRSR